MRGTVMTMKKENVMGKWLAPLLGAAVVGGGVFAATTYVNLEERTYAAQTASATIDRLYRDQRLSTALKAIHEGRVEEGAQRLDLLLCQDVLHLNEQMETADAATRSYVSDAFRRVALSRPKGPAGVAGGDYTEDQAAAERILAQAVGGEHLAKTQ